MKVEYIICENKAERDAVLRKLEKNGYIWANRESLTEWTLEDVWEDKPISFHLNKDQTVTWAFPRTEQREHSRAVSAQDYLGKHKPILITRKGRIVTAEDKNTGEKAIASCSPDDTFDFGTGAMIAVARLIAQSDKGITKDAETVLRQLLGYDTKTPKKEEELINGEHKYVVGDRVRVKAWEVLKGSSNFVSTMRHLCGRTATITNVEYDVVCPGNHSYTISLEFDDNSGDTRWQYQACMVEPLDESNPEMPTTKFKVGDLVTLKNDLEPGKTYGDMTLYYGDMFDSLNGKPKKVIKVWERSNNSPTYQTESEWYYSEEMLEPWDENKIREGDMVHVKKGCTKDRYDTYYKWLKDCISDVDLLLGFERSDAISTTDTYTVVKIAPHGHFGDVKLAFIKRTNGIGDTFSYLYDIDSLEKVTE